MLAHLVTSKETAWARDVIESFFYITLKSNYSIWPAPGSEDTELGVFMGPEVSHGETQVYTGV